MKKVGILLMTAMVALLVTFMSCEVSSDGGGSPKFTASLETETVNYVIGETSPVIYVKSADYLERLSFWELDNVGPDGTENEDISFTPDTSPNLLKKRWKITLSSTPSASGIYTYTLYVSYDNRTDDFVKLTFTMNVTKPGETVVYATPVITTQPVGASYNDGDTIKPLTVTATISSGEMSYKWYKNNETVGTDSSSCTPSAGGTYYVIVSNKANSDYYVKSDEVSIKIVNSNVDTPEVTVQPVAAKYAKIADAAALTVTATVSDSGTIHAQWYCGSEKVGTEKTGAGSVTCSWTPAKFGSYYCKVWNVNGSYTSAEITSKTVLVAEKDIVISFTKNLESSSYTGTELSVAVSTEVPCTYTYQWYTTDSSSSNDEAVESATTASYTPNSAGRYLCRVKAVSSATGNSKQTDSVVCDVSVKAADDPDVPAINTQPVGVTITAGESISLSVSASVSDGGALSYQWYKDNTAISGATSASYSKAAATESDTGSYMVIVTNTKNSKTATKKSDAAQVTVNAGTGGGDVGFDFNL